MGKREREEEGEEEEVEGSEEAEAGGNLYECRRTVLSVEQEARTCKRGFQATCQARSWWPGGE